MRLPSLSRAILPLLMFFGVLTLGLRIGDVWEIAGSGRTGSAGTAFAEEAHAEKPEAAAPDASPSPPKVDEAKPSEGKPAEHAAETSTNVAPDDDASPAEMEVLRQLSSRRAELDKRTKTLDTREQLLKVAEQRVDQKIKEMQTIRLQLQGMVDQISGAQAQQTENLVKIYETMKPKDAARIFETLDMPVLLGVIQRMKPKSTAPIMAEMKSEKAKEVTVALTKQDQIPQPKKE
ncbi:MAG: hypothetical protein AB7H77_07910 [Bdellovibrionales bacterium]